MSVNEAGREHIGGLSVERADALLAKYQTCDGCGRALAEGEPFLTGIRSCCGGGCVRILCSGCVWSAQALMAGAMTDDLLREAT